MKVEEIIERLRFVLNDSPSYGSDCRSFMDECGFELLEILEKNLGMGENGQPTPKQEAIS